MKIRHAALAGLALPALAALATLGATGGPQHTRTVTQNAGPAPGGGPTLIRIEAKIVEATEEAMAEAGVRLADPTRPPGSPAPAGGTTGGPGDAGADPSVLLARATGRGGVSLLAEMLLTARAGKDVHFESRVSVPVSTQSMSGGGITQAGFAGYQDSGVRVQIRATPAPDGRVVLDVQYSIETFLDQGDPGMPPNRSARRGEFTASILPGHLEVEGGMIRTETGSDYLLFYLRPTLVE